MLKFLVPVDGSEPNQYAIRQFRKYLGWMNEAPEIHLLNVQPNVPYGKRVSSVIGHERIARYQKEDGEAALKPARKLLDAAGIRYACHIGVGEPAKVIVQYAKEKGCDQILMGTTGTGSLSGLVLGSVATKVIHNSPVPVLVIRKQSPAAGRRR